MATQVKPLGIDTALELLFRKWNSIDAEFEHWRQREPIDHEVFELEWSGIVDGLMAQMERQSKEMSPQQRQRWQELLTLAEQKRPALEAMLASDG